LNTKNILLCEDHDKFKRKYVTSQKKDYKRGKEQEKGRFAKEDGEGTMIPLVISI
jgi:hypothetical protein